MRTPHSPLVTSCAAGLTVLGLAGDAHAVAASWLGGAGTWSDPTKWSSDPLYPCNGNGGQSFDVTISNGTVTLDLDCGVDAFTFSNGTLDGDFDLTANGVLSWSAGTFAGNGTTQASGGLALSGNGAKTFEDARTLRIAAGSASWSAGNISLGAGGATLRNQGSLTVTGSTGRSLVDTSDSGSFLNEGTFTVALDSASNLLTLSPGTLVQSGSVHVNSGVLALNATGSYTGSFDGAGSLRFSGGAQQLAAGSSATGADLEVTGGTLGVQPGASFAVGNVDVQSGTLSIDDASTTATAGTATMLSGTLTGAGAFETSGLLTWSAGTMSGSGTTRALGGLILSGSGLKIFGDSRTLDIAAGTASWSAGSISLGAGGATLRNQGTFTATGGTGHTLVDTGDTGRFLNEGTFTVALDSASNLLTLSPGTLVQSGSVHVNSGVLALNATGSHTGSFDGAGSLRFSGGAQQLASGSSVTTADVEVTGGTLGVQSGASFAVGNVDVQSGTLSIDDASTTATAGTATMLSGTLTGAGAFETSGLLTWSAGTMSGSGTTRALGGLILSGSGLKIFGDSRTLDIAAGTASWSGGYIALGAGGATLRNQGTFTATGGTGHTLVDTGDTGRFLNEGTFTVALDSPTSVIHLSPGTLANSGTLELVTGTLDLSSDLTQTAGVLRLGGGSLTSTSGVVLDLQGGALEGSGQIQADVRCACVLAPGPSAGQISVQGDLALLPGAALPVEVGGLAPGSDFDFVPVSGTGALAGTLGVTFLAGFENTIAPSDSLTILEAGAPLTGLFANVSSGERVITTPGLDSIVVRYGAGSPAGAQRVVLQDFRPFAPAAVLDLGGTAQGGAITFTLAGIELTVTTTAGQSAADVAAAMAAAINASTALARQGIAAFANSDLLETNAGLQEDPLITDPGIDIAFVQNVPALPGLLAALLALLLAAAAAHALRAHAHRASPRA